MEENYFRNYRKKNKKRITENQKIWRENNRERCNEIQKKYVNKNKYKIRKQNKEYATQYRSKQTNEQKEIVKKDKKERYKNKYKLENDEIILCSCGRNITKKSMYKHLKSFKHRHMLPNRRKLIRYIHDKIGDVGKDCKIDILNIISINCGQDVISESNDGVGIMFSELDMKILNEILCCINEDLSNHLIDFSDIM